MSLLSTQVLVYMVVMLVPKLFMQNFVPWVINLWNQRKVSQDPDWYEQEYSKVSAVLLQ